MLTSVLLICLGITVLWALVATMMLLKNPFPFPDKGHRVYGVPDGHTRHVVVKVLEGTGKLKRRFSFKAGPTNQTLMWDGFTVINNIDKTDKVLGTLSGNGLSLAVDDPQLAAKKASALLAAEGYTSKIEEIVDEHTPSNHLVIVASDAFNHWVLVFRRSIIKMPKPEFIE